MSINSSLCESAVVHSRVYFKCRCLACIALWVASFHLSHCLVHPPYQMYMWHHNGTVNMKAKWQLLSWKWRGLLETLGIERSLGKVRVTYEVGIPLNVIFRTGEPCFPPKKNYVQYVSKSKICTHHNLHSHFHFVSLKDKEVGTEITLLPPGSVIFEDINAGTFTGRIIKASSRASSRRSLEPTPGKIHMESGDGAKQELQYRDKDLMQNHTFWVGDVVLFSVVTDRRNHTQRATNIVLDQSSFTENNEQRETVRQSWNRFLLYMND